jgi:hypothetical protein
MDLLWPGFDARAAANNLHHALHIARRTLSFGRRCLQLPAASGRALGLVPGRTAVGGCRSLRGSGDHRPPCPGNRGPRGRRRTVLG